MGGPVDLGPSRSPFPLRHHGGRPASRSVSYRGHRSTLARRRLSGTFGSSFEHAKETTVAQAARGDRAGASDDQAIECGWSAERLALRAKGMVGVARFDLATPSPQSRERRTRVCRPVREMSSVQEIPARRSVGPSMRFCPVSGGLLSDLGQNWDREWGRGDIFNTPVPLSPPPDRITAARLGGQSAF